MAVGNGPLAAAGGDHGDVCRFRQFDEGLFRARSHHTAAGEYQGEPGSGNDAGNLPQLFPARHDSRYRGRIPQLNLLLLDAGLGRNLDENGTGASAAHLSERFGHGIRDFPRPERLPPPLGHRAQHFGLVRNFMDGPEVLAHLAAGDLAGNEEHGRGSGVGSGHARGGVVNARARDHQGHSRFPRHAGIAVGHVRRSQLVAGRDHADARFLAHGDDDPRHMDARDPEYDLDAFVYQRLHQGFAPGHFDHGSPVRFDRTLGNSLRGSTLRRSPKSLAERRQRLGPGGENRNDPVKAAYLEHLSD